MTTEDEKKYTLDEKNVLIFSLILTIGALCGMALFIPSYLSGYVLFVNKKIDAPVMGTFGDFIGGVFGTIFSLVTVFLVWLAYQSQKKELKEISNQSKEQIEIQAISVLIPLYKQKINELDETLSIASLVSGEYHDDYYKETILPAEEKKETYEQLLIIAENQLLTKSKTLFHWSQQSAIEKQREQQNK